MTSGEKIIEGLETEPLARLPLSASQEDIQAAIRRVSAYSIQHFAYGQSWYRVSVDGDHIRIDAVGHEDVVLPASDS